MKKHAYQLSSDKMTVLVVTNSKFIIVEAAPIVRKFVGQPIANLKRWMEKQGRLQLFRLDV